MMGSLCVRSYPPQSPDPREVLRYMGADNRGKSCSDLSAPEPLSDLLTSCIREMGEAGLPGRVCYRTVELTVGRSEDPCEVDLDFTRVSSAALARHLAGCVRAVVFAATVGFSPDRLIRRYTVLSPARALCLQAIGTQQVEALCDRFEQELGERATAAGHSLRPRFSPGYGDLPLALQVPLFKALDCPRTLGLSLSESLLMSPTKSVTAIIGIREETVL